MKNLMSFTPVPSPNIFLACFATDLFLNKPPGRPTTERPGALQDQGAQRAQGARLRNWNEHIMKAKLDI
jgi:hypothetical protein